MKLDTIEKVIEFLHGHGISSVVEIEPPQCLEMEATIKALIKQHEREKKILEDTVLRLGTKET